MCCGQTTLLDQVLNFMVCPKCGSIIATKYTPRKHQYLVDVCSKNDYKLVVDACAGSGMVQFPTGELKEGSPLILEKIMKNVGRCVCIEVDPKTVKLLSHFCEHAEVIRGDCNKILPTLIDGKNPTLVYIDPFGYGVPVIDRKLVLELSKTPNVDLLIHFSWRICREMGFARKYLSSDDRTLRKRAEAYAKSLNIWWGGSGWLNWGSMSKRGYAEKYASPFRENNTVDITAFGKSRSSSFYLILATKFKIPDYGIMKWTKQK
jgi:three-Cys-motif partner protein